jgi:hypothetical protein
LRVGFNPLEDLLDKLSMRPEHCSLNDASSRTIQQILFKKCFDMEIWSKNGKELAPLPEPMHLGKKVYHGSIIHFDKIPIIYHSAGTLRFYLDSRQIKAPSSLNDLRRLTRAVWEKLGSKLSPIPRILMRGSSGWISEEALVKADDTLHVTWLKGDELIECLTKRLSPFTESEFTVMFGKRNGSRKRLLKHVQGGSYNLSQLSVTLDMVHKTEKDDRLIVFESGCAPSMRLKNDNKDAFHNFRLCFYLDNDGNIKGLAPSPMTKCGCPNGCIVCSHLGGQIAMLHCLVKYCSNYLETNNMKISFEALSKRFPQPVHKVLKNPITVKSIYPPLQCDDQEAKQQWRKINKKINKERANSKSSTSTSIPTASSVSASLESESIDGNQNHKSNEHNELEEYAHEIAIEGIPDTSTTETIQVIEQLDGWVKALEDGRDCTGQEIKSVEKILEKTAQIAKVRNSNLWKGTQIVRMKRLAEVLNRQTTRNAKFNSTNKDQKLKRKDSQMVTIIEAMMPNMQKVFDDIGKNCEDYDLKTLVEDNI